MEQVQLEKKGTISKGKGGLVMGFFAQDSEKIVTGNCNWPNLSTLLQRNRVKLPALQLWIGL